MSTDEQYEDVDLEETEETTDEGVVDGTGNTSEDGSYEIIQQQLADATAEAKKNAAINERLQKKLKAKSQPQKQDADRIAELDEMVELRLEGYSKSEIGFIKANRQEGQSLEEVVKQPFVQAGISAVRQEAKDEDAIPSGSSNRIEVFDGKTYEDVVKESDDPAQKQKAFEARFHGKRRKSIE